MSTLTMSGTNLASPQSLSADELEESFVVLSPSLAPDSAEHNMLSVSSSMVNSASSLSSMPQLNKEITQAMSAMSVSATSELSPDEIHSKLESLLHENLQLKETLHQNNLAMKKQFNTLVTWQEDVMKVHQSHKEKFEETKKLIANLRAENAELKKIVQISSLSSETSSVLESEISALKSKITVLEKLREDYIRKQNEQSETITNLQMKIEQNEKEKLDQAENLNRQINVLKDNVNNMKEKLLYSQKKAAEMAIKIPSIATEKTIQILMKEMAELRAEIDYKNKVLNEKSIALDKLTEENKKLQLENETIPILQTQVDVYQTDFNAERRLLDAIKQEKKRLTEDLRHLQHCNDRLLKELEEPHDSKFVHVSLPPSNGSNLNNPAFNEDSPPLSTYICPLCSATFRSIKLLEGHVDHCIQ